MLPALVMVGVGTSRRAWIPVPVFLLWPLWLLGWLVWPVLALVRRPWAGAWSLGLILMLRLSGTRLDVDSADGAHVHSRRI